jgi:hypothetical protein
VIEAIAGTQFEAVAEGYDPGLLGTITVSLEDGQGNVVIAPHLTGIVESPSAPGIYTATMLAPAVAGTFTVVWQGTADGDPVSVTEQLLVNVIDTADALTRLAIMVDAEGDPPLTADELAMLLASARRADDECRAPGDAGWTPTYALGAAAAEGWTWKAGRAAARVDIADEAAKISRSQLRDACLKMAAEYRRRPMSAIALRRTGVLARGNVPEDIWASYRPLLPGAQGPVHEGPPYLSPLALPGATERGDSTA